MLTARGWWFFAAVAFVTVVGVAGVAYWSATVPVLGITLLGWFLWEWAAFAARYRASAGRIVVTRELLQGGRVVPAAWAGSAVTVRVTVTLTGGYRVPFVVLRDRPPVGVTPVDGSPELGAFLHPGSPVVIEYTLKPTAIGRLRFEGVQLRASDLAGFFYRRTFIRSAAEVLVLPPLTDDEGQRRGNKRFNSLPPPGVHRFRRPGSGSELLDLRDYQPGDPMKMIAWKPSARRDRLITKEYESDVPVRCVLFLDASEAARSGPRGRTPFDRLAGVAAGVAQAAAASRDLVGLSVFDETEAGYVAPARTHSHQVRLLQVIAGAANHPRGTTTDPLRLARHAFPVAAELYPDLLERDINGRPFGLYWLPISDTRWLWLVGFLVALPTAMGKREVADAVAQTAVAFSPAGKAWRMLLAVLFLPGFVAGLIWFFHGVRGLLAPRRKHTVRRKQLAAVYAVLDGAGPVGLERYLNDDAAFAARSNQFLRDHHVPPPIDTDDGESHTGDSSKISTLARTITRAVGHAHDNELYVILADLTDHADELGTLVAAARVARARHHQVVVVVPMPTNGSPEGDDTPKRPARATLNAVFRAAAVRERRKKAESVRSVFARAGVQVIDVDEGDPVRLVLDRLDRLRGARVR